MKYPLNTLETIRKRREDLAETRLIKAQRHAEACEIALQKAHRELEEFRLWCEREAERLMGEIIHHSVENREVISAREQIVWNRSREPEFIKKVESAEAQVEEAREEVKRCQEELHQLRKETTKLSYHRDAWNVEQRKEQEMKEDEELDEVSVSLFQVRR